EYFRMARSTGNMRKNIPPDTDLPAGAKHCVWFPRLRRPSMCEVQSRLRERLEFIEPYHLPVIQRDSRAQWRGHERGGHVRLRSRERALRPGAPPSPDEWHPTYGRVRLEAAAPHGRGSLQ